MMTDNKIRFSVVCLSSPISLTGKFSSVLFPFYPNRYILSGGPPLGGILANPVVLSCLLEAGFD